MDNKVMVFDIQKFSVHDGPGIRTIVFFKGCPLRCRWCANPESQSFEPELLIYPDKCVGCGRCAESCPAHTIEIKNGKAVIGRRDCIKCFCCQELCPKHAIEVKKNFIFKLAH